MRAEYGEGGGAEEEGGFAAGAVGGAARPGQAMHHYLLALDQGTSSSRAIVVREDGCVTATAQEPLATHYPAPGLVEQDAEAIWATQLRVARVALERAGVDISAVAALGIANQRETTVLWERATGVPVHPAIVWQDRRTAPACAAMRRAGLEPFFTERTGLLLDPYFSGTKVQWLLGHVPGLRARAARGELAFGTVDSWLLYRLSGGMVHATDVTNAARTLLFNLQTMSWDQALLDALEVPRAMLPAVRPSAGSFGTTAPTIFGRPLPITALVGDQQAALFGQGCLEPGMAKNTYGTGAFLVAQTGWEALRAPGLLTTPAWQCAGGPPHFALEAPVLVAGAAVQWLREGLGLIDRDAAVETLAASVPDSGGVYFVPALTGLGAPHWDPMARGLMVGLTRGTTPAHLARATLEAIAFATADAAAAMRRATGLALRELRVDGGAAVNNLLLQLQADLLGTPVLRPTLTESTAYGAAALAAVGAGLWPERRVAEVWQAEHIFTPRLSADERERRHADWRRAIALCRGWAAE